MTDFRDRPIGMLVNYYEASSGAGRADRGDDAPSNAAIERLIDDIIRLNATLQRVLEQRLRDREDRA